MSSRATTWTTLQLRSLNMLSSCMDSSLQYGALNSLLAIFPNIYVSYGVFKLLYHYHISLPIQRHMMTPILSTLQPLPSPPYDPEWDQSLVGLNLQILSHCWTGFPGNETLKDGTIMSINFSQSNKRFFQVHVEDYFYQMRYEDFHPTTIIEAGIKRKRKVDRVRERYSTAV